ncbi:MAG: hypothetical protein OXF41_20755 [bacterium]|nr:hypothetical protein [bacterium]
MTDQPILDKANAVDELARLRTKRDRLTKLAKQYRTQIQKSLHDLSKVAGDAEYSAPFWTSTYETVGQADGFPSREQVQTLLDEAVDTRARLQELGRRFKHEFGIEL